MAELSRDSLKNLIFYYSKLDKMFRHKSTIRWSTFRTAFNLFLQRDLQTIVETGCARIKDDWGGGQSTLMFGELCTHVEGAHLFTVDIDPGNMQRCREITAPYKDLITYNVEDSVQYLKQFNQPVDFLYLDSHDYPDGEIINLYGSMVKYAEIMSHLLNDVTEEEIVKRHRALLDPCQKHCLTELEVAWSRLHDNSIILLDDNTLPGGGKSRLAKEKLLDEKWVCLLDDQQSLWIKG